MTEKAADALRSIGEVSALIGVPAHVLRYWETHFPQLAPVKRPDGRRYYRPDDLALASGLVELLRDDGMTARGAQKLLAKDKGAETRRRGRLRLPERFHRPGDAPADAAERSVAPSVDVPEVAAALTVPEAPASATPAASAPHAPTPVARPAAVPRPARPLPLFPDLATAPGQHLARLDAMLAALTVRPPRASSRLARQRDGLAALLAEARTET